MLAQNLGNRQSSAELRRIDRVALGVVGIGVIFACLGLGEAVYRLLFVDFDGATDRLPIELLFGFGLAWMVTRLTRGVFQHRRETAAKIKLIRDRNYKIRHAAQAIVPLSYPANQQAVRVIREEVDRIEWALTGIMVR